jgi:hypothetical protein
MPKPRFASVNLELTPWARMGTAEASREGGRNLDGNAKCDCLHAGRERVEDQEHTLCHRAGLWSDAKRALRVQPGTMVNCGRLAPSKDRVRALIRHANWTWQPQIRGGRRRRNPGDGSWRREGEGDMTRNAAAQPVSHRHMDARKWTRGLLQRCVVARGCGPAADGPISAPRARAGHARPRSTSRSTFPCAF